MGCRRRAKPCLSAAAEPEGFECHVARKWRIFADPSLSQFRATEANAKTAGRPHIGLYGLLQAPARHGSDSCRREWRAAEHGGVACYCSKGDIRRRWTD